MQTPLGAFEEKPDVIAPIAERLSYDELVKMARTSHEMYKALRLEMERRKVLVKYWQNNEMVPNPISKDFVGSLVRVNLSPDGTKLVTEDIEHTYVWDVASGKQLDKFKFIEDQIMVDFSPDGLTLASAQTNRAKIWDIKKELPIKLIRTNERISSIAFSPDGKNLAIGCENTIFMWHIKSGTIVTLLHKNFQSFAFSADGKMLASENGDGLIKIWDVFLPRKINDFQLKVGPNKNLSLDFCPDNTTIALGNDEKIILWNIKSNNKKVIIPSPTSVVRSLSFSPDGMILASASSDGIIRLWEKSGNLIKTLAAKEPVNFVKFFRMARSLRQVCLIMLLYGSQLLRTNNINYSY